MACNTPILASFDTDSELAQILHQANAGICVEPENAESLIQAILEIGMHVSTYCGGRRYVQTNAEKKACVGKYMEILKRNV